MKLFAMKVRFILFNLVLCEVFRFNSAKLELSEEKLRARVLKHSAALAREKRAIGLDIFGTIMGLFSLEWDIYNEIENQKQIDTIILKLDSNTKSVRILFDLHYKNLEEEILITYRKRAKLIESPKNSTKYLQDFMKYYENHYGAAGEKLFNSVFNKDGVFGSKSTIKFPTNKSECYKFHKGLLVLFSKASLVELSYDMNDKLSNPNSINQTAQMWKPRIKKFQDAKDTLCSDSKKTKKKTEKTKELDSTKITGIVMGSIVALAVLICATIVYLCRGKSAGNQERPQNNTEYHFQGDNMKVMVNAQNANQETAIGGGPLQLEITEG